MAAVAIAVGLLVSHNIKYSINNCFLFATGTVPIIRCPRGNAADMVAEVTYFFLLQSLTPQGESVLVHKTIDQTVNGLNPSYKILKGTLAVQQYQSQIRIFFELCLQQLLKLIS